MLGTNVYDPARQESEQDSCRGVALLDASTTMETEKTKVLVGRWFQGEFAGMPLEG